MPFELAEAWPVWERTPRALDALLRGLSENWTHQGEGPDTFSPFEVVGHLVHGERTDWIPRVRRILEGGPPFDPFDRFAQREESKGKSMDDLLDEFAEARAANLATLARLRIGPAELAKTGQHPALGTVTLAMLLSTWVTHDLAHVRQIARVMAKRYAAEIGPWTEYMRVVRE